MDNHTWFRLYAVRIYGLFCFISVIWSMVNQILVLIFFDIWWTLPGQNCGPYIRNPVYYILTFEGVQEGLIFSNQISALFFTTPTRRRSQTRKMRLICHGVILRCIFQKFLSTLKEEKHCSTSGIHMSLQYFPRRPFSSSSSPNLWRKQASQKC